jgi:hypothetical protein
MAALDTTTTRNERRSHAAATVDAAAFVDAAFIGLEPGASVASRPSPGADDAGAALSDRSRHPAAARGVSTLLATLPPRRRRRRRRRARLQLRFA